MAKLVIYIAFLLTASLSLSCTIAKPQEWHMINVNFKTQGDAHLLIDNSINVMVDAGEKYAADNALIPYLQSKNIETIHHFFVSHPHTDHYGGIDSLLEAGIVIENIYFNLPPEGMDDWNYKRHEFMTTMGAAESSGTNYRDVSRGFSIQLPTSKIRVLYAHKEPSLEDGRRVSINDYSMIMQWDVGDFRMLFTGDLNEPLGAELAHQPHFKADVLKVPHHGVTGVAPDSFFNTVSPKLNMFPTTKALWNHPRGAQVRAWTTKSAINYCNNGLNGNVVLQIDGSSITAHSEVPSSSCPNGKLSIVPGEKINIAGDISPATSNILGYLLDE